jgi:hypothetical protein
MDKICSKCSEKKPASLFYNDKRYKDGKYPSCKSCQKIATDNSIIRRWGSKQKYYSEYRNRIRGGNPRVIFAKKKHNAISHNVPFELTVDEFEDWYSKQEKKCAYCDIPQELISSHQDLMPNRNIHRLTIDRVVNDGYRVDNICLACARCNLIKSNILSFDEAREIGQRYVKPKWQS